MPSEDKDLLIVKPLGGSEDEIAGIYLPLAIETDHPKDATFWEPICCSFIGSWQEKITRSS